MTQLYATCMPFHQPRGCREKAFKELRTRPEEFTNKVFSVTKLQPKNLMALVAVASKCKKISWFTNTFQTNPFSCYPPSSVLLSFMKRKDQLRFILKLSLWILHVCRSQQKMFVDMRKTLQHSFGDHPGTCLSSSGFQTSSYPQGP